MSYTDAGKMPASVCHFYVEEFVRFNYSNDGSQPPSPSGGIKVLNRMRKFLSLLFVFVAALAAARVAVSQSAPSSNASQQTAALEAYRQLLFLPAPTPRSAAPVEEAEGTQSNRPLDFYNAAKAPPDDAPTSDLLDYWRRWASNSWRKLQPSATVRARLLAACEAEPELLPGLLTLLPDAPETAERVKKMFDVAQGDERFDEEWRKSVREWLLFNSTYFLSDLLSRARRAGDKEGDVEKEEELKALAKVDWGSAEPLLRSLSGSGQPRTAAFAVALLYRHMLETKETAEAEHFRSILKAIASDRNAPAHARDTAVEMLSETEWPGRDEWYLSLFTDLTLLEPTDGIYGFSPLTVLFNSDPDKWIPVMSKLVESKDSAVRQNAASCLVHCVKNTPRRDAIMPVLRWLSDPDWLDINGTRYAWFMQAMDEVDVPESVPGLIWIVEHDESNRRWAARTLAHYKDPRAIPALRRALADEKHEDDRQYILQGLIASGGLTEAEQLDALEAYAAKVAAGQGEEVTGYRSRRDEPLPLPLSIGSYLARRKDAPDSLARALLAREESLRKKNPALARALLDVAEGWQARQVDLEMLRRIGTGTADAPTIAKAIERRAKLRENVAAELQLLAGVGGAAQGVAAVLLADEGLALTVLSSHDESARLALLGCARLTQMPLPVAQVGLLLRGKNPDLRLAAERYLLAEDSAEARALLWAQYPGKAFITGWSENARFLGGIDLSAMRRAEEKLRAELFREEDAPLEIFALLGNDERPVRVLRIYRNRAVYTHYEDAARYREAVVNAEQLSSFRKFLADKNLLDSGPQFGPCHHNCSLSEFLSLKREGGRRLFSYQAFEGWLAVDINFYELGRVGTKVHYRLEEELKGLEVLVAEESLTVKDVWQRGEDLRVFIEREETPEEAEPEQNEADESEGDKDEAEARKQRRRQELALARLSWRAFDGTKLGAVTTPPAERTTSDEASSNIDSGKFPSYMNTHMPQAMAGRDYVLAGGLQEGGLWRKSPEREAVRLSSGEGSYAGPVVTPDGLWAVVARTDTDWGRPNDVVRFNLKTGHEYRVQIPPAEEFEPVAYVAAHGKVLLRRARDEGSKQESAGPAAPEFYLLDAASGQAQLVKGDFEPLMQEGARLLQPTGKPDEFWAAVPDRGKNETRVGRYSTKDFSFRSMLVVPHITFESFSMWVDEAGAKLHIVYEGQLLRLPLPSTR